MLEFCFNPFPVIETTRLVLRAAAATDLDNLYNLRTNEATMHYLDREKQTREEIAAMLRNMQTAAEENTAINWIISQREDPTLMGTIGFWRTDKAHHRAEIGYMLHPEHWRKGYLSEALAAVLQYGFEEMKLHSIEAHVNPLNEASIGLLEKMGFSKEAYFRENYYFKGKFLDTAVYCIVNGQQS